MKEIKTKAKELVKDIDAIEARTERLVRECLEKCGDIFVINKDDIADIDDEDIELTDDGVMKVYDECKKVDVYPGFSVEKQYIVGLQSVKTPDKKIIYVYGLSQDGGNILDRWFFDDVDRSQLRTFAEIIENGEPIGL